MSRRHVICQCSPREFGPRIRSWSTFNEPGVFAFSGYVFGSFPPGKFLATQLAGLVVKHMLIAHDKAYHLIKSLPSASPEPSIMITDQCLASNVPTTVRSLSACQPRAGLSYLIDF